MSTNRDNIKKKPNPHQAAFLASFSEMGNISRACKAANVGRQTHYNWMEDAAYREAFSEAQDQAIDVLETEARRRAIEGVRKLKFHEGQALIDPMTGEYYQELDYSDTLLIFLMKGARPNVYRDNTKVETDGKVEVTIRHVNKPKYDE